MALQGLYYFNRSYNGIALSTRAPLQTGPRIVPLGSSSPQENALSPTSAISSGFGAGYSPTTLLSGHTLNGRGCCSNEQGLQPECRDTSQRQGTTSASPTPSQPFRSPLPVPQGVLSPIHPFTGERVLGGGGKLLKCPTVLQVSRSLPVFAVFVLAVSWLSTPAVFSSLSAERGHRASTSRGNLLLHPLG